LLEEEHFILFGNALQDYFNAIMWEHENRTLNRVPNLETYLSKRVHAGGVYLLFLSTNFLREKSFPVNLFSQEKVFNLQLCAGKAICIANDIFSYRKEALDDDIHNIVFVNEPTLRGQKSHYEANKEQLEIESILKAIQLHNEQVAIFAQIADSLAQDSDEMLYATTLKHWLRGVFNWTLLSGRYEDVCIASEFTKLLETSSFMNAGISSCE
jgi:hypothetical protein